MADIEIREDREGRVLEAYEDEAAIGMLGYFVLDAAPALVAVHTVVDELHEGRGVAGALVRRLYELAAEENVPVVALCPYTARWAERHPDEAPVPPEELVKAAKRQLETAPPRW